MCLIFLNFNKCFNRQMDLNFIDATGVSKSLIHSCIRPCQYKYIIYLFLSEILLSLKGAKTDRKIVELCGHALIIYSIYGKI